ncbi:MAG: LIC_13387 family protein [Candidatus Acidiferrales bacterium]
MTDKWGRRLFKTGAWTLVILGVAHSLSFFQKPVPANDTERQLFELMANYHFNLMGSARSADDLARGFSIAFMVAALGFGVLDLLLSRERAGLLKKVALVNAIWFAVMTAVSLRYFFAAPTAFLAPGLLIFAAAWMKLPREGAS